MKALLVQGNTYKQRHDIKRYDAIWDYDLKGWIAPIEKEDDVRKLCIEHGFEISIIEVDENYFSNDPEIVRARRQERNNRKADRLEKQIPKYQKISDNADAVLKPYDDFAFWTQPLMPNHHSYNKMKNLRKKLENKIDQKFQALIDKDKIEDRIDNLRNTVPQVKGDAEKKRQAERDANDQIVKIGTRVEDFNNYGTVIKINKKTYTVRFDKGFTHAIDKAYIRIIKKDIL